MYMPLLQHASKSILVQNMYQIVAAEDIRSSEGGHCWSRQLLLDRGSGSSDRSVPVRERTLQISNCVDTHTACFRALSSCTMSSPGASVASASVFSSKFKFSPGLKGLEHWPAGSPQRPGPCCTCPAARPQGSRAKSTRAHSQCAFDKACSSA